VRSCISSSDGTLHRQLRSYAIAWLIVVVCVPAALYGVCVRLFDNTNEFATIDVHVAATRDGPVLYNALRFPLWTYKAAVYRAVRPETTVVGTSRSMQVRDYFFKETTFYSLSGLVGGPRELEQVRRLLFTEHAPKHLIVVIDFWTFCDRDHVDLADYDDARPALGPFWPIQLFWEGHYQLKDGVSAVLGRTSTRVGSVRKLGLTATFNDVGFGNDGSYYYFSRIAQRGRQPIDARWADVRQRIAHDADHFQRGCRLREDTLAELKADVERLAAMGISVVAVLAPLPSNTLQWMREAGDYGYIDELRRRLPALFPAPAEYYDRFVAEQFGSPPCEFLDGHHGGEVAYARMLLDIVRTNPSSTLASILDTDAVARLVSTHAGKMNVAANPIGDAFRAAMNLEAAECPFVAGAR